MSSTVITEVTKRVPKVRAEHMVRLAKKRKGYQSAKMEKDSQGTYTVTIVIRR